MDIPKLNERAMLVKLTTRRANLTRRDEVAEQTIQQVLDDASLTVNSKLFRDKSNPVNQIMSAASRVYQYHKNHTHPHIDRGPRVIPNALYMEYSAGMREAINAVDNLMAAHLPKWDQYVQQDIDWRCIQAKLAGKVPRASVSDYPTASDFQASMAFDVRVFPLPERRHFLYDISEEDEQKFNESMADLAKIATNNTVIKMLEPLKHLAEVLAIPIGTTDPASGKRMGIFRDSAIENVFEGIELAKKLAIDPPPEFTELTKTLEETMGYWAEKANWLRESPINRKEAADKLNEIASQMGAFMCAA